MNIFWAKQQILLGVQLSKCKTDTLWSTCIARARCPSIFRCTVFFSTYWQFFTNRQMLTSIYSRAGFEDFGCRKRHDGLTYQQIARPDGIYPMTPSCCASLTTSDTADTYSSVSTALLLQHSKSQQHEVCIWRWRQVECSFPWLQANPQTSRSWTQIGTYTWQLWASEGGRALESDFSQSQRN